MKSKSMYVKAGSLFLALLLILGQSTSALAENRRFADPEHGRISFSDMKYVETDSKECMALAKQIKMLTKEEVNGKRVISLFEELLDAYDDVTGMNSLVMVLSDLDTQSDYYRRELERTNHLDLELSELLRETAKTVLNSPCGSYAESVWDENLRVAAAEEAVTAEQKKLMSQENKLLGEYSQKSAAEYTAEWKGKQLTIDRIDELYDSGELTGSQWNELYEETLKKKNAALGTIYLDLVKVRNRYAATVGMNSYLDYSYESYQRSYTTEDTTRLYKLAEQILMPLEEKLTAVTDEAGLDEYASEQLEPEAGMELAEAHLNDLAPELAEAYRYMRQYGLYDISYSQTKTNAGYTILLPADHSLFMFNQPTGSFADFSTFIHEFGHFNQMYWAEPYHAWPYFFNVDLSEVHSQGLELLYLDYYDDMLGSRNGMAQKAVLYNLVDSITSALATDQLEQFAYNNPEVTLEEFNRQASAIRDGFGYDPDWGAYDWVEIAHIFETPGYYISYATSAIAAFELWAESLENRENAIDDYFTLMENPFASLDEALDACGIGAPYRPGVLEIIRSHVERETGIFRDSYGIWSEPYIDTLALYSFRTGRRDSEGVLYFDPEAPLTRAEFVSMLYQAADHGNDKTYASSFKDVKDGSECVTAIGWACGEGIAKGVTQNEFRPDDPVSRQDMALMTAAFTEIYHVELPGAGGRSVPFKDQKQIADYALDAVLSLRKDGVLAGYPDKTFEPEQLATREEAAAVLAKLLP